jgi:hypothetical protein
MNLRQVGVILIGICGSFACLTTLVIPHPGWRALEHEYRLGGQVWLRAAPPELLCFALLAVTVPLTIVAAVTLRDRPRR